MLYDSKWEKPKTEVFSINGLVEWLKKQNPRKRYNYQCCNGGCLAGLYLASVSDRSPYDLCDGDPFLSVFGGDMLSYGEIASTRPWTFGSALKRAEKWQAEH